MPSSSCSTSRSTESSLAIATKSATLRTPKITSRNCESGDIFGLSNLDASGRMIIWLPICVSKTNLLAVKDLQSNPQSLKNFFASFRSLAPNSTQSIPKKVKMSPNSALAKSSCNVYLSLYKIKYVTIQTFFTNYQNFIAYI